MLLSSANIPHRVRYSGAPSQPRLEASYPNGYLPCEPGARLSTVHDFMHQ